MKTLFVFIASCLPVHSGDIRDAYDDLEPELAQAFGRDIVTPDANTVIFWQIAPLPPHDLGWTTCKWPICRTSFARHMLGCAIGSVVAHELGHALGLPHSSNPNDIMHIDVPCLSPAEAAWDLMLACRQRQCVYSVRVIEAP